jgi:hypothetical protein
MLIPFGVLSAAAGGVPFESDYELIASEILGSAQSFITFSNLGDYSTTYKHLQIRTTFRTSHTSAESLGVRINADTGANYVRHGLFGNGSSVSSFAVLGDTELEFMDGPISSSTANVFATGVMDILDAYSSTKNKTARTLAGSTHNNVVILHSGLWLNTNSITSLTLRFPVGNLVAGSRFSLYGIKG